MTSSSTGPDLPTPEASLTTLHSFVGMMVAQAGQIDGVPRTAEQAVRVIAAPVVAAELKVAAEDWETWVVEDDKGVDHRPNAVAYRHGLTDAARYLRTRASQLDPQTQETG